MKNFEETMRNAIINSYIKVYGVEKWNGLTNEEKDMVLHIMNSYLMILQMLSGFNPRQHLNRK